MIHKVGDFLFFALDGVAGEGIYIGNVKADPGAVVLVIGKQFVEVDAEDCSATGRGRPAEGESWRRAYLKEQPGRALQ